MLCFRSNPLSFLVLPLCLFIFSTLFSFSHGVSHSHHLQHKPISDFVDEREFGEIVEWNKRRFVAENSSNSTYLILAANRTHRRDPSNGFKFYTGGWDILNLHYLYSVGFSAAPPFVVGIIWFLIFGVCLCCMCIRRCFCCCCRKEHYSYSRTTYALSLSFLILLTFAAIVGTAILYTGQERFQSSIVNVLSYVLHQADTTVVNLRDLLGNLFAAKNVGVGQVSLPVKYQANINHIETSINLVANRFRNVTVTNSKQIRSVLDPMRLSLIYVAAAMLILALLGFLFSILGVQCFVSCLVIIGWVLVAGTFILSGMFLLVHNAVADTCIAMDEWLQNPTANSALENILPKVDDKTAQDIFSVTKGVTFGLVDVVNGAIANVSNTNFPPNAGALYYNQSGPLMPLLCNPYNSNFTNRKCAAGEVDFKNASEMWRNYICHVSPSGICTTTGRLTPESYTQMMASVNVTHGLYGNSPFLLDLIDSTFVKETFSNISKNNCPSLSRYSKWTYVGFIISSTAVMLSLIIWIVYARERRQHAYTKNKLTRPLGGNFIQDKAW